jgi:lysozyme family protein
MLPLVGLAATIIPDLIRLIARDKSGTISDAVSKTVSDVTKTSDPIEAVKRLQSDPAATAELQVRLAQIAVDAEKAQNQEADRQRQDEMAMLQASIGNTEDARGTLVALARSGSGVAWAAPVVSLIVTLGFFAILGALIFYRSAVTIDANTAQIVNIIVGALAAAFATVVNFWLGSSQESRSKDTNALQLQATHAAQINHAIDTVRAVSNKAIDSATATATATRAPPSTPPAVRTGSVVSANRPAQQDNFDACVALVLTYEGGFSDNPYDAGGATNFGITQRTLEAFLGHACTVDDVRNLSSTTAAAIYRANYWNLMRCGDLPAGVDLMVFDYGVNSGPGTAVKALQGLVGVTQDGAIGPITLAAVANFAPLTLVNDLAQQRLTYLRGLSGFPSFGTGWTRRVAEVQAQAQQMAAG